MRVSWYVTSLAEEEPGQGQPGKSRGPRFTILGRGGGGSVDCLVGSFCLETAVCAAVASRLALGCFFLVGGTVALVRRGWRMLRDSPSQNEMNLPRRSLVVVAIIALLVAFAAL